MFVLMNGCLCWGLGVCVRGWVFVLGVGCLCWGLGVCVGGWVFVLGVGLKMVEFC